MVKTYRPYGEHIWIQVLPVEEEVIVIGGEEKAKPVRGKVLAIGDVPGIQVGDVIIYNYYSAVETQQAEEEFLLIHRDDILAIEEDDNGN